MDLPPHDGKTNFSLGFSGLYTPSLEQDTCFGAGKDSCCAEFGHSKLQMSLEPSQ